MALLSYSLEEAALGELAGTREAGFGGGAALLLED